MNIKSIAHAHRRSEKAIRSRSSKLKQRHRRNEPINNNVIIENGIEGDDEDNEADNDIDLIDADFFISATKNWNYSNVVLKIFKI